MKKGLFSIEEVVCTKTLYHYIDLGIFSAIRNIDLPEKMHRKPKTHRIRENKRIHGRNIEERAEEVKQRKEFGHWEMDLVCGSRTSDDNVLSMAERKSCEFLIVPLKDKAAATINDAVKKVMDIFSEHMNEVFKTITADNGSEFAELSKLEENTGTKVYYTHPFTFCEKGTVERHKHVYSQRASN